MGNLLQYTDKSKTIDEKLKALLAQINYQYKNGEIKTETEYYYKIKNMLSKFYESLTKPTFIYRPAVTTPVSSDYNSMIHEAYNDMSYIIKDCEALQDYVSQSFTDAQLSRTMMSNELTYLTNKVNIISTTIAKNQGNGTVVFSDSFNDFKNTGNMHSEHACTIDTFDGILTLGRSTMSDVTISDVSIDNEFSNGFPGNTHCVDTLNSSLHYIGQDGLHNNPNDIADGNKDTWFEFELFNISDKTRKECNNFGFDYEEGPQWVDNNKNFLRLKLVITLANETTCSWVSMLPYISDAKGGTYCILEKCEVFTDSNNAYKVAENIPFKEILTFAFPPQPVRKIEMTFTQYTRYLTKIGHNYYSKLNTNSLSVYQDYEYEDSYTRVDGWKPKVSVLGVKYDPTTKWLNYTDDSTSKPSDDYTKSVLFTTPESTIDKKANVEILDAYRYMIGIREINVPSCTFVDYSEYISTVFRTDEVITSVTLSVNEFIPGNDTSILKYYISLDYGVSWYEITPLERGCEGVYKYYINNDSIENLLNNNANTFKAENLSIMSETKNIQLKIAMKKPVGTEYADYTSPVVYSYKLKVTTGGDTIEY